MAIQIDLSASQFGVPFAGAYFRIVTAAISRQRQGGAKFSVMVDVAGYGAANPKDNTREIDFRRYHAPLEEVDAQQGATFLDRCYAWVMSQSDMTGCTAV